MIVGMSACCLQEIPKQNPAVTLLAQITQLSKVLNQNGSWVSKSLKCFASYYFLTPLSFIMLPPSPNQISISVPLSASLYSSVAILAVLCLTLYLLHWTLSFLRTGAMAILFFSISLALSIMSCT